MALALRLVQEELAALPRCRLEVETAAGSSRFLPEPARLEEVTLISMLARAAVTLQLVAASRSNLLQRAAVWLRRRASQFRVLRFQRAARWLKVAGWRLTVARRWLTIARWWPTVARWWHTVARLWHRL